MIRLFTELFGQSARAKGANSPAINKRGPGHVIVSYGEDAETAASRHHAVMAAIALDKGVPEAPLREVLKKLGETGVPIAEIPARLASAADELVRLRDDLARLRNDRPEFAAFRTRASALIDQGEFDAARAMLRDGRMAARAL